MVIMDTNDLFNGKLSGEELNGEIFYTFKRRESIYRTMVPKIRHDPPAKFAELPASGAGNNSALDPETAGFRGCNSRTL